MNIWKWSAIKETRLRYKKLACVPLAILYRSDASASVFCGHSSTLNNLLGTTRSRQPWSCGSLATLTPPAQFRKDSRGVANLKLTLAAIKSLPEVFNCSHQPYVD